MGAVNLKEARRRLSALVQAAERGESVVITRRGKEVARIVPPERRPSRGFLTSRSSASPSGSKASR